MIFWAYACATHSTQCEFIAVNGQTTTSAFHKVVYQQYLREVGKTIVIYVTFVRDVACPKFKKSANVSQGYSKNDTCSFFETRCSLKTDMFGTEPGLCIPVMLLLCVCWLS